MAFTNTLRALGEWFLLPTVIIGAGAISNQGTARADQEADNSTRVPSLEQLCAEHYIHSPAPEDNAVTQYWDGAVYKTVDDDGIEKAILLYVFDTDRDGSIRSGDRIFYIQTNEFTNSFSEEDRRIQTYCIAEGVIDKNGAGELSIIITSYNMGHHGRKESRDLVRQTIQTLANDMLPTTIDSYNFQNGVGPLHPNTKLILDEHLLNGIRGETFSFDDGTRSVR